MTRSSENCPKPPLEPNLAAFLAALVPPLSGLLFLRIDRGRPLVRFHAMQSLVLGGAVLTGYGLLLGLAALLRDRPEVGAPLTLGVGALFVAVWLTVWLVQLAAALSGHEWTIPVVGTIARRLLTHRR